MLFCASPSHTVASTNSTRTLKATNSAIFGAGYDLGIRTNANVAGHTPFSYTDLGNTYTGNGIEASSTAGKEYFTGSYKFQVAGCSVSSTNLISVEDAIISYSGWLESDICHFEIC
jgi:hypothetical protein